MESKHFTSLEHALRSKYEFEAIVGHHPKMIQILEIMSQIANTNISVLVQGESGTGKELVARAIHNNSCRNDKPFIPINCAAIPENLLESELYGYAKGAFTGANLDKIGLFESGDGGTIFLDEVGEMSQRLQAKLLRFLETGEFVRVGDTCFRYCNIRVLAATNNDLKQLIQTGKFREDLFYRLNVISITIPPLRERRSDIPLLIHHFLLKYKDGQNREKHLSKETEMALLAYHYPGNIRELENAIQCAAAVSDGETIYPEHLPAAFISSPSTKCGHTSLCMVKQAAAEKAEKDFIMEYIKSTRGNISKAAKLANIDVSNFYKIIKKHKVDPNEFKKNKSW